MECPECKGSKVYVDWSLGEYYCYECGLIIEDSIIDYSDTSFLFDSKGNFWGGGVTDATRADKGLGTLMYAAIRKVTKNLNSGFFATPVDKAERSYSNALPFLRIVWNSMSIPQDLRVKSALLYRKCVRKRLTKGRDSKEMALAVVYAACMKAGAHVDISKAAEAMNVTVESVMANFRMIEGETSPRTALYVQDYLTRGIEALKLPDTISRKAFEISKGVLSKKLEIGKHPAVVAGAIIYKAGLENNDEISQERIAKALGVSSRSIRRLNIRIG